ncbi:MAG TPA: hypothetical protein VN345_16785 [Blastocatellia bacterium]|nr:hypothetical protein [Blastocatellia bacterium]
MNEHTQEHDTPWKEIIETLFPQFMGFFFPNAHAAIDWSRAPVFLDKELQQIVRGAATGRRFVDKLVKVWQSGGQETWVLVHIEVQGQRERAFPKRMFVYHNRLFDRYARPVASFVVLADDSQNWRPHQYRHELWGTETVFRFATTKLLDFDGRWEELEKSKNPFAMVVMSHLKAHATTRDRHGRLRWKLTLAKMLLERGYKDRQADHLFRFMDYVLALPEELEDEFDQEVTRYAKEGKVTYLSRFERKAMERGMERGVEKGLREGHIATARAAVIDVLESRFDRVPRKLSSQLNKITDADRLRALIRQAATAATVKDFERQLTS